MVTIPLKLKYRNPQRKMNRRDGLDPPEGTWTFSGGKYKATSSNAGTKSKGKTSGTGARRRAYGPWFRQET